MIVGHERFCRLGGDYRALAFLQTDFSVLIWLDINRSKACEIRKDASGRPEDVRR